MNNIKNQIKRFSNSKRVALIYRLGFCTSIYLGVTTAIGVIFTNYSFDFLLLILFLLYFTGAYVNIILMELNSFKRNLVGESRPNNIWLPIMAAFITAIVLYISYGEYGAELEEFVFCTTRIVLRLIYPDFSSGVEAH
ncbi:hypothetical protein ACUNHT_14500 [Serratia sp. IR-2025]